jgi:phage terminase large subunit
MAKIADLGPGAYPRYLNDVKRYLADPFLAAKELLGVGVCKCNNGKPCVLDPKQAEIITAVFRIIIAKLKAGANLTHVEEEAGKLGVLVQSAKGTGKTAIAAMICILFMFCMKDCKIFLVGPKEDQIKSGIWPEIAKWFGHASAVYGENNILNRMFDMPGEIVYSRAFITEKKLKKEWVTRILTFPKNSDEEQQKTAIQGKHSRFMLFILEECPGIPDYIFEAIRSTCTDPIGVNMCLGIFNPNKNTGWAIEGMKEPKTFTGIQISAIESSLVSRSYIERIEEKYGKDSNVYRVSVLGLPPLNDNDGMFPWNWLQDAVDRQNYMMPDTRLPILMGCDIGGGGDPSVICLRQGNFVLKFHKNESDNTVVVASWIERMIEKYAPSLIIIDKNGLGNGVFNSLSHIPGVVGFNSKNTAHNPDKFVMIRDEVFWRLRTDFEKGDLVIPNDTELIGELSTMKYDEDNAGLIKVISKSNAAFKKEMRQAVGYASPNKSDALAMTYYKDYSSIVREVNKRASIIRKPPKIITPLSWMGA